jgi:hypothetical protein
MKQEITIEQIEAADLDLSKLTEYMATQMMCPFGKDKCHIVVKIVLDEVRRKHNILEGILP